VRFGVSALVSPPLMKKVQGKRLLRELALAQMAMQSVRLVWA
jgi:hypothetical protein